MEGKDRVFFGYRIEVEERWFQQDLAMARVDGSYPKIIKKGLKAKILVLDDMGLVPKRL